MTNFRIQDDDLNANIKVDLPALALSLVRCYGFYSRFHMCFLKRLFTLKLMDLIGDRAHLLAVAVNVTKRFVFKMMNFVSNMTNFVLKMTNFVLKMMNFALKMMNFVHVTNSRDGV